jgi:hypothetical protein
MTATTKDPWALLRVTIEQRCPDRADDIRRLVDSLAARSGKRVEIEHARTGRHGVAGGGMKEAARLPEPPL